MPVTIPTSYAHGRTTDTTGPLADLSISDLRALRGLLGEEEHRVSYWRRLIQARIDVVTALRDAPGTPAAMQTGPDLRRILGGPAGIRTQPSTPGATGGDGDGTARSGRRAHADARAMDLPTVTGVAGTTAGRMLALWERIVEPGDERGIAAVLRDLSVAEEDLSRERADLHARLDAATAELVRRYALDPRQALTALPRIW